MGVFNGGTDNSMMESLAGIISYALCSDKCRILFWTDHTTYRTIVRS